VKFLPVLAVVGVIACHAADDPTISLCNAPVTETAVKYVGTPYVRAGGHPERGFDCSGFTRYVFEESCGFELPRSSWQQSKVGVKIPKTDLQPGDLLVFREPRRLHMGLYLGDGQFIHSPNVRGKVRVESMESGHFQRALREGRRVLGPVELTSEPEQAEPVVKKVPAKKAQVKKKTSARRSTARRAPVRQSTAKAKTASVPKAAQKKPAA
jgi:hypothetical protein